MNRDQLDQLIPQAREALKQAEVSGDEMATRHRANDLAWLEQRRDQLASAEARREADAEWAETASPRELAARVGH